mgnify:CR=1 FL=1
MRKFRIFVGPAALFMQILTMYKNKWFLILKILLIGYGLMHVPRKD